MSVKHVALATLGIILLQASTGRAQSPAPAFQLQPVTPIPALASPSQAGSVATKLPVSSDLLKTVMDKQEEMLLLDLEIKKATMEQQLKEIQGKEPATTSMQEVDSMIQKSAVPALPSLPLDALDKMDDAPTLVRISKQNDELVAMIQLSDGGMILASKGQTLPGDWTITTITTSSASARQGNRKPVQLKFAAPNNGQNTTGSRSTGSSLIRSVGLR